MKQVDKISIKELDLMAKNMYGDLVKADVDIEQKIVVVDMPMHVDGEEFLLESGSKQKNLWGINLYPGKYKTDKFVEFESMINVRPRDNNFSRGVEDEKIRAEILKIIEDTIHE